MSAWQVDFVLVPQRALAHALRPLTQATLEKTAWWAHTDLPEDYRARLGAFAPPAPSLDGDLESWGAEEGNRIDVRSEAGHVTQVCARVDVRRLDPGFGAGLLAFVKRAQSVLVRRDGLVAEPTVTAYSSALRSAPAWRFVNDPAASLADAREGADDE